MAGRRLMSAEGYLVGRKRERPAECPGPKGTARQKGAVIAIERSAAAHPACTRLLTSQTYPDSLSELAPTLQHIFGAKLVVLQDSSGAWGVAGLTPAQTETRGWLEALAERHLEGRESSVSTFDLEAGDAPPPLGGIRRFIVVPLPTARGRGALWLGFDDHGPSPPEELTCISVLGEHLS